MCFDRFCGAMAEPHWDQFLSYALKASSGGEKPPADNSVLGALENVLYWTPDNGKAHVRLASLLLGRFEQLQQSAANSLPLNQISEAAMASREHFHSKEEMDAWLDRAIGENRRLLAAALWHLGRGMAQCPLLGEGYIHLADLCFLKGQGPPERLAYLNQALQVRPYDGVVLLAAGSAAALRGDVDAMIACWRPVLRCREQEKMAMVRLLTSMPIPIEDVLSAFEPNLPATRALFWRYSETTPHDQLGPLYAYYSKLLSQAMEGLDREKAAPLWREMYDIYAQAGRPDEAINCLREAVAGRPADFDTRLALGVQLNQRGRFAEARQQLEWCVERRPGYAPVKEHLAKAVKGQIEQQSAAATTAQTQQRQY
jgi:tetratricopeptide (TPR) repeat protein